MNSAVVNSVSSGSASARQAIAYCVFRLHSGLLALDARLVGEITVLQEVTALPGCHAAVLGLANLRGRALAVIDLDHVLSSHLAHTPPTPPWRVLVLRLPGCEAGALVQKIDGVFIADPAHQRSVDRMTEPPWIAAFQDFTPVVGGPSETAALIDPLALATLLEPLRGAPQATGNPASTAAHAPSKTTF